MVRVLGAILSLVLLEPPTDSGVSWEGTTTCPEPPDLLERLQARGVDVLTDANGFAIHVTTEPHSQGHALTVTMRGPDLAYTRTIVAQDCEALWDAGVLVVAVTLEQGQTAEGREQGVPEIPKSIENTESDTSASVATETKPPHEATHRESVTDEKTSVPARAGPSQRIPWAWAINAGGGAAVAGLGPQPAGQLALGVFTQRRRVRLGLGVWSQLGPTVHSQSSTGSSRLRIAAGTIYGCFVPGGSGGEVPLCGGLDAGILHAQGRGFEGETRSSVGPWLGVQLSVRPTWRITARWSLRIDVIGSLAATRPRIISNGLTDYQVSSIGLRGLAMIEHRFSVTNRAP